MSETTFKESHDLMMGELALQRINEVIRKASYIIRCNPKDCFLYIPDDLIHQVGFYLTHTYGALTSPDLENGGSLTNFSGYKILPGYEAKIVLAHKWHWQTKDSNDYISIVNL